MKVRAFVMSLGLSLFALASVANAQVDSTPAGWNGAEMELTMTGTIIDQVEFQVPSVTLELDYGVLAPQQRFWVYLPVMNNTDRPILVNEDPDNQYPTFGNGSILGTEVEPPSDVQIAPGATYMFSWRFAVSDNAAENLGQTYTHTFGLVAEGVVPQPTNQVFGQ